MRWPWQKSKWGSERGAELDRLMHQPTLTTTPAPRSLFDPPFWPGDCPRCGKRCDCRWRMESVFEGSDKVTYATWQLGVVACPVSRQRAEEWARKEVERRPVADA